MIVARSRESVDRMLGCMAMIACLLAVVACGRASRSSTASPQSFETEVVERAVADLLSRPECRGSLHSYGGGSRLIVFSWIANPSDREPFVPRVPGWDISAPSAHDLDAPAVGMDLRRWSRARAIDHALGIRPGDTVLEFLLYGLGDIRPMPIGGASAWYTLGEDGALQFRGISDP